MTVNEALKQLKTLGSAKVRAQNAKSGAGDNQFGVSLGDIRTLAKKIRTNHELALSLWETGFHGEPKFGRSEVSQAGCIPRRCSGCPER